MGRNIFRKLAHTPSPRQSAQAHDLLGDDSKPTNERESNMGEIVIMGIGFDRPTVTLPMSATKEQIVGAIIATTQEEETETGEA
jgi:hypothetical protein